MLLFKNLEMEETNRMESICGMDCCSECSRKEECGGCRKTDGHPLGEPALRPRVSGREGWTPFGI